MLRICAKNRLWHDGLQKALTASDGDVEKAIEFLREKGLAAAAKKSGRVAAEGVVCTW